jgi:ABC-type multidrug transport system permease subunit
MGPFFSVLRKDLLRRLRSPLATVILLAFPLIFSLLIGFTFGSGGEKIAPVRLALVDEDGGIVSRMLRSSFNQQQSTQRFDVQVVDRAAGMRLVEKDKVSACLFIPAGFSDSLLSAHPTSLELVKNPAQGIYPEIAEQYVRVLAQLAGAAVRILGPPVQQIRDSFQDGERPTDAFVSNVSVAISRRMAGVGRYAIPPAIKLEKAVAEKKSENVTPVRVAVTVLPGLAIFALLTLALISLSDFHREGVHGTLSRQFVAPVPFRAVILGKVAASWLLSLLSIIALVLMAALWARADVSIPGFVALSLCFALAATGFAALIHSLARNERAGSAVGSILVMILSMAGGCFIPFEALPRFVQTIAPFTPTYWGSAGYRDLLFSSAGLGALVPNLLVLGGIGVLCSAFAVVRFTRRYATGG